MNKPLAWQSIACWHCCAALTRAEAEDWWARLLAGRTGLGPYCSEHQPPERAKE
jgi:hypothetical protein